jgi:hypothetical protein
MLALTLVVALAQPIGDHAAGVDAPLAVRKRVVGHNNSGDVVETCRVYARVAVVDVVDPAQMGARSIAIRVRAGDVDACAPAFAGVTRAVTMENLGYVDGVRGRWLVINDADALGDEYELYVVDVDTGREVLRVMRSITSPLVFEKDGSLTLGVVVRADCNAHDDAACRARTLLDAHVPAAVHLDFDARCAGSKDAPVTAALPARVDLAHPVVTFRDGAARCMPSP